MNDSIKTITLSLQGGRVTPVVKVKKYDTARVLQIRLTDGGEPYNIDPSWLAVFTGKKPDRTSLYNTCDIKDGMAVYTFTEQTTAAVGTVECELRLYSGESLITTVRFNLEVYDTVYTADDAAASQDEQTLLNDLINKVLVILNYLKKGLYFCDLNSTYAEIQAAKAEGKAIYFLSGSKAGPMVVDVGGIFSFAIETADPAASVIYTINEADEWSNKVGEVSDPINPTDAANKRWVEELLASGIEGAKEILVGSGSPEPSTSLQFDPDGEFFQIMGDTAEDPKVLLTQAAINSLIGTAGGSKLDSLIIKSDGIPEITSADDLHKYCYDRRKDTARVIQFEVSGGKNQNIIDALGGYPEGVTSSDPEFVYLSWPYTEAGGFTLNAVLMLRNSFGIWTQTQYATYSTTSPTWHKSGWIKLGVPVYAYEKGKADGVATLGKDGKVPAGQLPPYPEKTSDLTNDSGFITADDVPVVPDWAMQPKKPDYTASEVGALPDTTIIPSKNSELENDESYEKALTVKVDAKIPGVTSLETLRTFFYERRKATQRKAQFEISKGGANAYLMDILGYPTGATAEDKAFLYIEIPYSEAGGFEIRYRYQLRDREGIWKMVDYATLNSGWKTEGWNPVDPFNDSAVDNQYGWHSKKIIDTLCMPFEQTGPVVTCHPVENYPLHVVSEIAVKQEGSGDPSPENVRPIVMHSKVDVTRCGANLFDKAATPFYENGYANVFGEVVPDTAKNYNVYKIPLSSDLYTFNIGTDRVFAPAILFYSSAGKLLRGEQVNGRSYLLLEAPSETAYALCSVNKNKKNPYCNIDRFQVLRGEYPQDQYIPFIGETYTAQLPEPVAGGVVDWEKGEAREHFGKAIYNGTENWKKEGEAFSCYAHIKGAKQESKKGYCDIFKYWFYGGGDGIYVGFGKVFVAKQLAERYGTLDAFKAQLAKTPMTVLYELDKDVETPITPSSSTPLALPGVNTLYSSTGDTTVTGRQDPIYTAENLISRVTALENNAVKEI